MIKRRRRNSRRNQQWNYSSKGWYFLTIVTHQRQELFGKLQNGEMHLNEFGNIVMQEWEKSKILRPLMHFDCIVVMPDHVQMLVQMKRSTHFLPAPPFGIMSKRLSKSISSFIGLFKAACTRRIVSLSINQVWQRDYDDQIIRTRSYLNNVRRYIRNNPREAQRRLDQQRLLYNRRSTA
jgi:REP element-mobilizing transposase RayT